MKAEASMTLLHWAKQIYIYIYIYIYIFKRNVCKDNQILSSNSTWLLVGGWLFCIYQHLSCFESFRCIFGGNLVMRRIECTTFYFSSLGIELIFTCHQEVLKWVWPLNELKQNTVLWNSNIVSSNHAPSMVCSSLTIGITWSSNYLL